MYSDHFLYKPPRKKIIKSSSFFFFQPVQRHIMTKNKINRMSKEELLKAIEKTKLKQGGLTSKYANSLQDRLSLLKKRSN